MGVSRPVLARCLLAVALLAIAAAAAAGPEGTSLRFYGNGVDAPALDRVVIPLDEPHRPVDVGASDLTVELWLKALPGENASAAVCQGGNDDWIYGNIVLDRDVFGNGDWGDWGISLMDGRLAFGVYAAGGGFGATACGTSDLATGIWRHVAVTRRFADGELRVYVDGVLEETVQGPAGDTSYRDGRPLSDPAWIWEPYLVIGAEKHDAGASFPSYSGWVDELHLSTVVRYAADFVPPGHPFTADAATAALYHFDEGSGDVIGDSSSAAGGPSDGERRFGGSPAGPEWSSDSPFADALIFADGFESGDAAAWSATAPRVAR